MIRYWRILDAEGEPVVPQAESETEPDPADYGGTEAIELPGRIDPACLGAWNGTDYDLNLTVPKAAAIHAINTEAEAIRNRFITPGAGQALTYQRKEIEARAWSEGAAAEDFPFLAAEAASTGMAIGEVAALVVAQADAWIAIGAQIEGLRRGALVAVEAAETPSEITAARAVEWGLRQ